MKFTVYQIRVRRRKVTRPLSSSTDVCILIHGSRTLLFKVSPGLTKKRQLQRDKMKSPFVSTTIASIFICFVSSHSITPRSQYSIVIKNDKSVVNNSAILAGSTNSSVTPIVASSGQITHKNINDQVVQIQIKSNASYTGARFNTPTDELFYGVWEYPFSNQLTNTNVSFDLKGIGNADGINWSNARAPFFLTTAGYGVYADTLQMGSFDFATPGQAQFVFNTSALTYYIIQPKSPGDYKSIIEEYTALSSRTEMPPDSGYGPEFWSDDFTTDFHGSVGNAQENYFDVVDHLYYNEIRATSMFADSELVPLDLEMWVLNVIGPYGTGNWSFGNFDFDPKFYPNPKEFIANLTAFGFDFQVMTTDFQDGSS